MFIGRTYNCNISGYILNLIVNRCASILSHFIYTCYVKLQYFVSVLQQVEWCCLNATARAGSVPLKKSVKIRFWLRAVTVVIVVQYIQVVLNMLDRLSILAVNSSVTLEFELIHHLSMVMLLFKFLTVDSTHFMLCFLGGCRNIHCFG